MSTLINFAGSPLSRVCWTLVCFVVATTGSISPAIAVCGDYLLKTEHAAFDKENDDHAPISNRRESPQRPGCSGPNCQRQEGIPGRAIDSPLLTTPLDAVLITVARIANPDERCFPDEVIDMNGTGLWMRIFRPPRLAGFAD